jgi:predicted RNA-binding protein with TRAM domain
MTNPIEVGESLDVKIQTLKKGTNTNPIDIKNQKYVYIEILSTNKSLEISKDEVFKNKTQDTRMPYRHPKNNSHRIIQRTNPIEVEESLDVKIQTWRKEPIQIQSTSKIQKMLIINQ